MADITPQSLSDNQSTASADVFFVHPTTYTRKGENWNASLQNIELNKKTDETTIKYQASIFNGAGKVFVPRYRQAHLSSFYTKEKDKAKAALDLAYQDVRSAFSYFLENENNGRPIIIAAHSQGAVHALNLLKEFFDGQELQQQLVVAYLIGWPVLKEEFSNIEPCWLPQDVNCVCSWRTFKYGYTPKKFTIGEDVLVTNPLSWNLDESLISKSENKGAILRDIDVIHKEIADAQIHNGILWTHKPKFPGSFLFTRRNYHIADLNFYYVNVRENAISRVEAFIQDSLK